MMTQRQTRHLSTGKVARALGLSNATVQGYAREGRIPANVTPGKQYRYNLDEVQAALRGDDLPAEAIPSIDDGAGVRASMTAEPVGDARSEAWAALRGHPAVAGAGAPPAEAEDTDDFSLRGMVRHSPASAVSVLHRPS